MLFPILGPSSLPLVEAQPDERHANRTASMLEWNDRHSVYSTSGSNEEDHVSPFDFIRSSPFYNLL